MRAALLSLSLLALGAGCASGEASRRGEAMPPGAAGQQAQAMEETACPMAVPGTQVRAEDTPDGVAVLFTTSDASQVEVLRERVRTMVAHHGAGPQARAPGGESCPACEQRQRGAGPGAGMGGAGMGGEGMTMPPFHTRVEDVPGGVAVVHVPEDPAQREALRSAVKQHVAQMQSGECPMRSMQGQGQQQGG